MNAHRFTFSILLLLATALPCTQYTHAQRASPLHVEQLSETLWRVTATHDGPVSVRMPGDPPYTSVLLPGYETMTEAGLPALPVAFLAFALPPGGSLAIQALTVTEDRLPADLAPFGGTGYAPGRELQWVEITPVTVRDGLRSGGVRIFPVLPAGDALRWARTLSFEIRIHGDISASAVARPLTTSPLLHSYVNSEQAAAWRVRDPGGAAFARPSTLRREGDIYLAVYTDRQGLYSILPSDLQAWNVDVQSIDARTFRLYHDGGEIPVTVRGEEDGRFDPGDAIEFFAYRKQGEYGEYFDEWSDDNVFFLEWNGEPGLRAGTEDVAPLSWPQAATRDATATIVRLEQDLEYHRGDFEYGDMQHSARVPGEGWMWTYLLKKDSLRIPFLLQQPLQREASLEFRVKGASRDPSRLQLTLNGVILFDQILDNYDTARVIVPVPVNTMLNGENILVFRNVGVIECPPENPACSIERIYVDWAELHYLRAPSLADNVLEYNPATRISPAPPDRALLRMPVQGLLRGVNMHTGAQLAGIDISGATASLAIDGKTPYHLYGGALQRPRTVLREFRYLANPARQADYIVVTHPDFVAQARRLADYRARSDGYSAIVANVNDIYDEFNNGHKNPSAIKAFLHNAWEKWSEPRPRFVLLMGDASWDAKFRKANSTKTDFVPTYGNPASDNYYVRFAEKPFDPTPFIPIGRIPAETATDADAVIDKVIEYESLPPQVHDNRFLFSIGGENAFEQDLQLRPIAEALILNNVLPYCLEARRIYKRTLTAVSYDDLDTLIHEVNQGVSWFFFAGHGGTRVIDVGIERPDIFSNKGKYPFFATISCNTAHFAEPFETGLNERFILAREHGSIASFGTAGLGLISHGYVMARGMFRAMNDSGMRTYGELVHQGKLALIASNGIGDVNTQHSVDQHCILGDPATRVPLARGPELLVLASDISTEPDILTEQERTRIDVLVRNVGVCMSDSIDVRLRVLQNTVEVHAQTQRIAPFSISAALQWEYDFAGIEGEVILQVMVDAADEIAEAYEDNNIAELRKSVLPRGATPIFPLDNAVIASGDEISFLLANPSSVPEHGNPTVQLSLSTDAAFMNNVLAFEQPLGEVYTTIIARNILPGAVYYWRARMTAEGRDGNWSSARSFRIDIPAANDVWKQDAAPQLANNRLDALQRGADGAYRLGSRSMQLEVTSGGFNGPFRIAILRVDGQDVSPNMRGFNCAVVEPRFGEVVSTANFDTYLDAELALDMLDYVRAVPDDHVLMLAVLDDANGWPPVSPNGSNILPELKSELRRFGATLIDSVGYRDSYGFIGSRARPTSARELHFVLGTVLLSDTIIVNARQGSFVTQRIGPANAVTGIGWSGELPHDRAAVDLRLIGRRVDGSDSLYRVFRGLPPGENTDIGILDCMAAPFLRVEGLLRDESGDGSPVFRGLELRYTSLYPEIGITSQVVRVDADSVLEGESIAVDVKVINAGRVVTGAFDVSLRVPGSTVTALPVRVANIVAGGAEQLRLVLPTVGLRGRQSYEIALDPPGDIVEYYRANNAWSGRMYARRDGNAPQLEVLFDGLPIVDNDYVRSRPEISIVMRDLSPLPVTDTAAVQVMLNGRRIWLLSDANVQYSAPVAGEEKVRVFYTPDLPDGLHFLSVLGKDASGNVTDSIPWQVRFYVSTVQRIDQIIPWPSPTTGPMDFTFRCSGADVPVSGEIRIYTLAGRLIRRILTVPGDLRVGFNRVAWDGRDEDGDAIANGVYFYKLIVAQQEGQFEYVGRFSVLR